MVSAQKQQLVQTLTQDIDRHTIIGIMNIEGLPASQYQNMRKMLAKKGVKISMARKRLIQRALEGSKKNSILSLSEKMKGMPALIMSNENPFSLYSTLQKNKSESLAKPGQTAPRDIVVKAGPTNFAPGPIISEFAAVGIKTKVEAGKLAIITDTTIVKEGQPISQKVAETLKRLDIKPMEIGLNLVAVWENGFIFDAKTLRIDEAEYYHNFTQAAQWAMNLAVESVYITADTRETLLQKAFCEAKTVALATAYLTEETLNELLARSEQEVLTVKKEANL